MGGGTDRDRDGDSNGPTEGDGEECNGHQGRNRRLENGVTNAVIERSTGNGQERVAGGRSAGARIAAGQNRGVNCLLGCCSCGAQQPSDLISLLIQPLLCPTVAEQPALRGAYCSANSVPPTEG